MSVNPISSKKATSVVVPEFVIQLINEMIEARLVNKSACFMQEQLIALIILRNPSIKREDIFKKRWLNSDKIKKMYNKAKWDVLVDYDGCRENKNKRFTFRSQ